MDLHQLRCFVAAAEELHFGRAAQRLDMLPSALGRFIRLLEEDLGTRLMTRTTRSVALTDDGAVLLKEARALLAQADALAATFRARGRKQAVDGPRRRDRQRRGRTAADAAARFPRSGGPMSRSNWSRTRRSGCCRGCCPAGSTLRSCALRKAPDKRLEFLFPVP